MNVIFLTKRINVGGVAIVTIQLANKMAQEGYNVSIFVFSKEQAAEISLERISPLVHIYWGFGERYSRKNVNYLHDIFLKERIDVAINQWGLHWFNIACIRKACKGLSMKVITIYHNDPSTNGQIQDCDIALANCNNRLKRIILKTKRIIVSKITSWSMRYVYRQSDYYMLLSPSFISGFKRFTGIRNTDKLMIQTNPVTIDKDGYSFDFSAKEQSILYVGRIDFNSKRLQRIVEVWRLLEKDYPDWKVYIVGDGPDRPLLESLIDQAGLTNISLEGFQKPIEYYKRASVLVLTSEFEGFPLVLAECMSFGVIPVVLGSYSAVYDIIQDGKNGFIIEYDKNCGFKASSMADKIKWLMENGAQRECMAIEAIHTSQSFSLDTIYEDWNRKLADIIKDNAN